MLTRARLLWISLLSTLLLLAASLPATGQIHGVPPSVTSFGFGGSSNPTPGTPASVTSLGPFGFDCCSAPFIAPFPRRDSEGRHFRNHHQLPAGEMTPAIIPYFLPYPVPYEDYSEDEQDVDVDRSYSRGVPAVYDRGPWYRGAEPRRETGETPLARKEEAPAAAPGPTVEIAPQPATVLVYKDGRKMEVQNYAILNGTLFDFTGTVSHKIQLADLDLAATRKTNDERGVEFRIPGEKNSVQ